MKMLVIIVSTILLGLWTLLAWAAAAVLGAAGSTAAVNADLLPVPPEWVVFASELFAFAGAWGPVAVWIVWGLGAVLIIAVTVVLGAIARKRRPSDPRGYPN